jgi:hypothetical protein
MKTQDLRENDLDSIWPPAALLGEVGLHVDSTGRAPVWHPRCSYARGLSPHVKLFHETRDNIHFYIRRDTTAPALPAVKSWRTDPRGLSVSQTDLFDVLGRKRLWSGTRSTSAGRRPLAGPNGTPRRGSPPSSYDMSRYPLGRAR